MTRDLTAPFVGRAEELLILADAFDAAKAGQFVPVLVGGEAGVGKTRLVSEFAAGLPDGTPDHWGRCVDAGGAPPYWPWMQILQSMTRTSGGITSALSADRFTGFAAVATRLREEATRPIVLVLDDLHVADVDSLELLRFLVRAVADIPVLLLGTHRDPELRADPERDVILGDVARFGRRLAPPCFDRHEVGALLEGIVGEEVPSGVVDAVLDRTAGNALFVDETARVLVSNGFASVDVMPDGVRAAVRARLKDTEPRCREALAAAAVLGGRVEWSLLAALLDISESDLADRLEPAMAIGVIAPEVCYLEFCHGLIRDAIREDLTTLEQAALHRRAAETLQAIHHASLDAHAAAIAQHYADASLVCGPALVAEWASRAASVARALYAHEQAATWSDRAAAAYARLSQYREQAEELARAADDLGAVGNNAGSDQRARLVSDLARMTGSGELLARAAKCRSAVFGPVREGEAPALLREALDHPHNAAPSRRRAELSASLAIALGGPAPSRLGRAIDAAGSRAARRELDAQIAAGVSARDLMLEVLQATEYGPESFAQRHDWLEEYTRLGVDAPDPFGWRIRQTYWAASLAFESGRLDALRRELDGWGHVAGVLGVHYWDWKLAIARASLAFAHGRLTEAEERAEASLALTGDVYRELTARAVRGIVLVVRFEQGRVADMVRQLPVADLGPAAMLVHIERGDADAATALVTQLWAAAERSERDIHWLCLMTFLAWGAFCARDRGACGWVVDELAPFADQFVMFGRCSLFVSPVAELVGIAAHGAGRLEVAERHLRRAVRWAEEQDAPGLATRSRFALASVLDDAGPSRQAERMSLLRRVIEVGSRVGMAGFVERAELSLDGSAAVIDVDAVAARQASGPAIRTFGGFSVTPTGSDEPVRWSSKKARDTLKFLVTRRGAAVSRERLIEMLWPGTDLPRGRHRLSVILTMVRNALDPDRRWPPDHYLRADRDVVSLRKEHLDIDLDRFLEMAALGLRRLRAGENRAVELLEDALDLAQGGFLVEDIYADWPARTRTEIATTYAAVLRALAEQARQDGDHDALVLRLSQLADRDPYDEQAHEELMAALHGAGRPGDARRQEERYSARLAELHPTDPA